ncbi:MAG: FAD-dependent oxidoreductase [Phycisphaerae bacterium]
MVTEPHVLIFGGGGAGLWLLDELRRRGVAALLAESTALGAGQTIASQGILHGGIKYTLAGMLTESANAIRNMPGLWRDALAGRRKPDLTATPVLAHHTHLWRTTSLKSRAGLVGARVGLRSGATRVARHDRPTALASCPGDVFRVDEPVIDTAGFLRTLAEPNRARLLHIREPRDTHFDLAGAGRVNAVRLISHDGGHALEVRPNHVVLTSGAGNAALRRHVGLSEHAVQRRPLHMVLVRGDLPMLYGHCVDGAATRATVTSARDADGRVVWQVGGHVAETGVRMSEPELIDFAHRELTAILHDVAFRGTQWATYRIDRAEAKTPGGRRPVGATLRVDGNVITAMPTKLVLVPELARLILNRLAGPDRPGVGPAEAADHAPPPSPWPTPAVALPPWELDRSWHQLQ